MKVTINKETGLGRPEHSRENYLPVISQSGEILTEGTWECEKVYQLRVVDGEWFDFNGKEKPFNYTRQVYRVVLPTQPDVKETVENAATLYNDNLDRINKYDSCTDIDFKEGANWHKQQVWSAMQKVRSNEKGLISLADLIKVIEEI